MTLQFPNDRRSFDEGRNAVRLTGHVGMFEAPFLIGIGDLGASATMVHLTDLEEEACLTAFDRRRSAIHAAASKAYAGGRRQPYSILTVPDIR